MQSLCHCAQCLSKSNPFSRVIARCLELGLGRVTDKASKATESDDEMEQRATKEGQEKEDHDSDYESDVQPDTVGSILTL